MSQRWSLCFGIDFFIAGWDLSVATTASAKLKSLCIKLFKTHPKQADL